MKLTGLAAKEMQEKDAVVYANIPALRGKLLPQLQKARAGREAADAAADGRRRRGRRSTGAAAAPRTATPGPASPAVRPANRPGQRPAGNGTGPSSRADNAGDVELASFQNQPTRQQPGRRPATPRPQAAPGADADSDAPPARRSALGRRPRPGGDEAVRAGDQRAVDSVLQLRRAPPHRRPTPPRSASASATPA